MIQNEYLNMKKTFEEFFKALVHEGNYENECEYTIKHIHSKLTSSKQNFIKKI